MHWGNWNAMQDWWWVMALGMTVFWGLVIWAVIRVVGTRRDGESPRAVLQHRLAAGEINEQEYDRLRAALHK